MRAEVDDPSGRFVRVETRGGAFVLAAAVASLVLANSPVSGPMAAFWNTPLALDLGFTAVAQSLRSWVNDGLMAVFLFVMGLEMKRQVRRGALSAPGRAALPLACAAGALVAPMLVAALAGGGVGVRGGWSLVLGTDLALALGIMGVFGDDLPSSLRSFFLSFGVVSNVLAVTLVAGLATDSVSAPALGAAVVGIAVVLASHRFGVRSLGAYVLLGAGMWLALGAAGIAPALAGLVMAALTPEAPDGRVPVSEGRALWDRYALGVSRGDHDKTESALSALEDLTRASQAPLERFTRRVHPWSAWVVVPLFAIVNAGVDLSATGPGGDVAEPVSAGLILLLAAARSAGMLAGAFLVVRLGRAELPAGAGRNHLVGAAALASLGLTVSLFVADIAWPSAPAATESARLAALTVSGVAAAVGYFVLKDAAARTVAGRRADVGSDGE